MRRPAALVPAVLLACASGAGAVRPEPPPAGLSEEAARATLERFAGAVEGGRWADAHALLSARWRDAYTPSRLAVDFAGAGPVGREAARRVQALLAAGARVQVQGPRASLPDGTGGTARLVAEEGRWRVDALE